MTNEKQKSLKILGVIVPSSRDAAIPLLAIEWGLLRRLAMTIIPLFCLLLLIGSSKAFGQHEKLQYKELVGRLMDLKALAVLPVEGEESAMWSSYDRKSRVDSVTGEFIHWAANNDGLTSQYIRKEGENMVLAEMEGPGAIVRMWSASPQKGHVKIYIDGKEVPVLDMPFRDYFNTNSIPAFNYPQLVYETNARGFNNYVPITYQDSAKIVAEPGWGQYYHFNYISFPEGTKVEPFKANPTDENAKALSRVNRFFAHNLGELSYNVDNTEVEKINKIITPGDSAIIKLTGRKAIYMLKANLSVTSKNMAEALRKVVLKIQWDGSRQPAVWSPIGDFFGSAPGYNLYKTLPMGMTEKWMYSYWYMPFQKSAVITIINHFEEPVDIDLKIGLEKLEKTDKDYGYFHAKWHRNILPVQDPARWPDWTILETKGRGRYLGMSLLVWNPKGGHNRKYGGPGYWWWGEGDAKFFVDGETFPSTFGTGTEDYFGYAWCVPNYFARAFHSQSHTDDNMGYQSLNRWQIIENVPFQKSFKGYIEKYFPDKWPTQYAVTVYWYLNSDGTDPIEPTPVDELYGWEIPYTVYREPGVIEAEDLRILKNTGGYVNPNVFINEKLFKQISGHKILLWNGKPNAENELITTFNLSRPGTYKVTMNVVKSPNGGIFRVYLNGKLAIESLNMKTDVKPGEPAMTELGIFELLQGDQQIKFVWIGPDKNNNKLMVDYIDLELLTDTN